jgi:hypothetical protein
MISSPDTPNYVFTFTPCVIAAVQQILADFICDVISVEAEINFYWGCIFSGS